MSATNRSRLAARYRCSTIGGFDLREYQFPQGVLASFDAYHQLDGIWEGMLRCPSCGQIWHRSVAGGHADIEVFNRVDEREAAKLIEAELVAAPLRAADLERSAAERDAHTLGASRVAGEATGGSVGSENRACDCVGILSAAWASWLDRPEPD